MQRTPPRARDPRLHRQNLSQVDKIPQRALCKPVSPTPITLDSNVTRLEAIESLRQQAAQLKSIMSLPQSKQAVTPIPPRRRQTSTDNSDIILDLYGPQHQISEQLNMIAAMHADYDSLEAPPHYEQGAQNTYTSTVDHKNNTNNQIPATTKPSKPPSAIMHSMPSLHSDEESPSINTNTHLRSEKKTKKHQARDFLKDSTKQLIQPAPRSNTKKRKMNTSSNSDNEYPALPNVNTRQLHLDYTPAIPTSNPFEVLANPLPDEEDMNQDNPSPPPLRPKKETLPPPIRMRDIPNFLNLARTLQGLCTNQLTFASSNQGNKRLKAGSISDFRAITAHLTSQGISFHTFALQEEKRIKLVIRGIDGSIATDDVRAALGEEHGIIVEKVAQLTSFRERTKETEDGGQRSKTLLPLFVVYVKNREMAIKLKQIKRLCYCQIQSVEDYHTPVGPVQCYRCQGFGHTSSLCSHKPRCLKCAHQHATVTCQKARSEPARCANCGQAHTANYRGCPAYSEASKRLEQSRKPHAQTRADKTNGGPLRLGANYHEGQVDSTSNQADKLNPSERAVNVWEARRTALQPQQATTEVNGGPGVAPEHLAAARCAGPPGAGAPAQINHNNIATRLSSPRGGVGSVGDEVSHPRSSPSGSQHLNEVQHNINARNPQPNPYRQQATQATRQPWQWQNVQEPQTLASNPDPHFWDNWARWANHFLMEIIATPHHLRVQLILSKTMPLIMAQSFMSPNNQYGATP